MKTIIFVCHGNICRSPCAEVIANTLIKKNNLKDKYRVFSRALSYEEIGNEKFLVDSDNNPTAKAHIKAEEKFQVVCKDDVYRISHQYKFEYKIEALKATKAFDMPLLKGDVLESLKEGAGQNDVTKGYEHAQLDLANFVKAS